MNTLDQPPSIWIVMRSRGDGFGHTTVEPEAWAFDEEACERYIKRQRSDAPGNWHSIVGVRHVDRTD